MVDGSSAHLEGEEGFKSNGEDLGNQVRDAHENLLKEIDAIGTTCEELITRLNERRQLAVREADAKTIASIDNELRGCEAFLELMQPAKLVATAVRHGGASVSEAQKPQG